MLELDLRIDVDGAGYHLRSPYGEIDETYPDLSAAHERLGALLDAAADIAARL